ncbi:MAG: helix-turn-helix transcriptional regulator [Lachnospiraceae bacterium]|nr:helix-turn-helix transcriptional regulator [Lachnospiraceae bacterium]
MYTDFCVADKVNYNTSLGVYSIYRVFADRSYRVNHLPRKNSPKKRFVFVYTDWGSGVLSCANGDFVLEAHTALIFSMETSFTYRTLNQQWNFWWFEFDGDFLYDVGRCFYLKNDSWMEEMGRLALSSLREGRGLESAYLTAILAFAHESADKAKSKEEEIFARAQELIREKLYHNSVASLASQLCVEPRTLYNLFLRYAGCSPKKYLKNYCIDHAKYLLLHTTKSVGQISDEIGFSNQFHFSRVFRETIGMTPSEYRQTGGEL